MGNSKGNAAQIGKDEPEGVSAAPVILALDNMGESDALLLARSFSGRIWGTKINDLLLHSGAEIIARLKAYGQVFCDAKLHDIPNTVAHQVALLDRSGADLITLHCAGGAEMLRAAVEARKGKARLLGVTVLTALSDKATREIYGRDAGEQVRQMTALALACGLDGIICSPMDLPVVDGVDRSHKLLRVTPGVRPAWYGRPDDQSRTLSPEAAIKRGADLLVIGRPITTAENPLAACDRIVAELAGQEPRQ